MMNGVMMKQAVYALNDTMKEIGREVNAEEIAGIVESHAIATSLSAAAAGVVPGAGGAVAFGIACTSTITMYGRLAKAMGVRLNNGLIRAVASAVVADLAAAVAATVTAAAAISFIPGVGSMASAALNAVTNFGFVYLAGIIFIKLVAALGVSKVESMSENEIKEKAKNIQNEMDIKAAMKEARTIYKDRNSD
ncbi:MAG: hypothetical protein IJ899_13390 [Blautia sp.]|nr:hypothetical protein [Blautia sp.]